MGQLLPARRQKLWLVAALGILLFSAVCILVFVHGKKPHAPAAPVVSTCKPLAPDMRRIGERYGLQFEFPTRDFTVHEGTSDAAPIVHGFGISAKNSKSLLEISFGRPLDNMAVEPVRIFSSHVEKRSIFDDKGLAIGEDSWGYLSSGERWRKVQFRGMVGAKYSLVNESEAELFDRVINSACVSAAPAP